MARFLSLSLSSSMLSQLSLLLLLSLSTATTATATAFTTTTTRTTTVGAELPRLVQRQPQRRQAQEPPPSSSTSLLSSATPPPSSSSTTTGIGSLYDPPPPDFVVDAVVVGAGPAGLLSAVMLARKYPTRRVLVYDRLPGPPPFSSNPDDGDGGDGAWTARDDDVARYYLIGLGGRGQSALRQFGLWDGVVLPRCVPVLGRKDWPPDAVDGEGVERIFTERDKHVTTQVLPREKLVSILYKYVVDNFVDTGRIELNFGYEVRPLDFEYCDVVGGDGGKEDGATTKTAVLIEVAKCSSSSLSTDATAASSTRTNPSSLSKDKEEDDVVEDVLCDTDASFQVAANLLVAADGTIRTFANAIEREDENKKKKKKWWRLPSSFPFQSSFRVTRYVDDNQRVYKTVPVQLPKDDAKWRYDLNYSARSKGGRFNFDALPANDRGKYCGVVLLMKDDPLAKPNCDPDEYRAMFRDYLPAFNALLDDDAVAQVAKKPVSYLPAFRYVGPRLHQGDHCVLLGDCAHTVKPYFGLGANSALEDVKVLSQVLDETSASGGNEVDGVASGGGGGHPDIGKAVREFSKRRAPEAKAMVRISRDLDRPGKLGFVTFILPLILDSIFNGIAPKLFQMNVIAMMQREQYTFQQVARRKRIDRAAQIAIVGTGLAGATFLATKLIRFLARTVLKGVARSNKTTIGVAGGAAAILLFQKLVLSKYLEPGLAPADVLARLRKKVTNSRTHLTPLRTRKGESAPDDESDKGTVGGSRSRSSSTSDGGSSLITKLIRPHSETTRSSSTTTTTPPTDG